MEKIGLLGFIFGMAGLSWGIMAFGQINVMKKDIETLKEMVQKLGKESD